jgi:diamine N-acetyltransferase
MSIVTLREITPANVRAVCALEVQEDQKGNVAANAVSLAEAYASPTKHGPVRFTQARTWSAF